MHLRKGFCALAAMVAGAMMVLSGCGKPTGSAGGDTAGGGTGPIKVGVILPLTGSLGAFGQSTKSGVDQRVKELNAAGGVGGRQIELVVEDNKGETQESVSAYKKLTGVEGVVAVIGPITSTNCLSLIKDVSQTKIPLISPTATNDTVAPKSPYVFRACFNDSFQGQILANYAIKQGHKAAALMVDMGSDYSKGLSASFAKSFEQAGGKIVAREQYQPKDTEFGPQLSKVKESGATVVFVPGYPPEVPQIVKQAGVMGLGATFCGADGWDDEAVLQNAGEKIVGSFIVGAFSAEDTRPAVQAFVKTMGPEAGTFAALGYDTVSLLAEGLASGTGAEQIRATLGAIKGFEGVTGKIDMSPSGDATKSAVVMGVIKTESGYGKKYLDTVDP